MKKIILLSIAVFVLASCATTPVTGRKRLAIGNNQEILSLSFQQYDEVKHDSNVITGTRDAQMIKRVGDKMSKAVEEYLDQYPQYAALLDTFDWEFILIESDQVNAWCLPGGKVAFYTGILPYTMDENGIAVVMSHEIAHAVAEHSHERYSQAMAKGVGGSVLGVALDVFGIGGIGKSAATTAYDVGGDLTFLKYGRDQELEADQIGLVFMTLAGYNPQEAIPFWERMAQSGGGAPVEFLSTHPNDSRRIGEIQAFLASDKYKQIISEANTSNVTKR